MNSSTTNGSVKRVTSRSRCRRHGLAWCAARATALAALLLAAAAGRAAHAAPATRASKTVQGAISVDAAAAAVQCPPAPPPFIETQLPPREAAPDEALGVAAAISGDTAVFGAPLAGQGTAATGAAYVFVRTAPSTWSEQARLLATGGVRGELFGASDRKSTRLNSSHRR